VANPTLKPYLAGEVGALDDRNDDGCEPCEDNRHLWQDGF
jgi:hypothetical protein